MTKPEMDVEIDREYTGEGVQCVFRKEGRNKTTTRVFDSMQSALNMAVFIASQNGINDSAALKTWLEFRGFEVETVEVAADRAQAAARLAAAGPFTLTQGGAAPSQSRIAEE